MKHTMKKLLCMALAIMLLVSAVPVFAAAEDATRTVDIYVNNTKRVDLSGAWSISSEATMLSVLQSKVANVDDYDVAYKKDSAPAAWNDSVGSGVYLEYRLTTKMITVGLSVDGTMYYKNLPTTSTYTINNDILTLFGAVIPAGKEVASWVNAGQTVKPAEGMYSAPPFVCYLRDAQNTATGIITAVYSVDGGAGVEKKISSNAETVASLMEKGGYSQSSYELTKAGLGGTGEQKGLNDTIVAGQKVYIKMATKTTPSNPTNPTTPTTPSTSNYIKFAVKVDSSNNVVYDGGKAPANGSSAKIGDLIKNLYDSNWASKYDFDYAWSSNNKTKITDINASVYTGDTVTVMLKTKSSSSNTGSSYDYGTEGIAMNFLCDGRVVYTKVVKSDAELEVAKAEAVNKIKALGCYQFNGWK